MTDTQRSIDNLLTDAYGLAKQSLESQSFDEAGRQTNAAVAQVYATIALVETLRATAGVGEERVRELVDEAIEAHRDHAPHRYADGSTY